jgi:hypothetical protein
MHFKDWFLSEEIYPNKTATVYHRTHEPTTIANIIRSGFRPGPRCFHGCGLYSTYLIDAQFSGDMDRNYGKYIMEYKVTDLDKYLIFEASEAKKIHGANWRLSSQIRLLSPSLTKAIEESNISFEQIDEQHSKFTFSSSISRDLHQQFKLDSHGLRGIVYYGQTDGPCLLKYEPINEGSEIVLLRYAYAPVFKGRENLNWVKDTNLASLRAHSMYKQQFADKEFFLSSDPIEKLIATNDLTKIKVLLKKGIKVKKENVLRAMKSSSKELRDLVLNHADWDDVDEKDFDSLFANTDDQNSLAEKIVLNKKNWYQNDTWRIMDSGYQINLDRIAKLIIDQGRNLSDYEFEHIFYNVKDRDDIAEHIINSKARISNKEIENIMKSVKDSDRFAKLIIEKNPSLDEDAFVTLIYFSLDKNEIAKLLFEKKGFLTDFEIQRTLENSQFPMEIAEFIIDNQEKLSDAAVVALINGQTDKKDKNFIAKKTIKKLDGLGEELFEKLMKKLSLGIEDKTLELMLNKADFQLKNFDWFVLKNATDKDHIAEVLLNKNPKLKTDDMWEILRLVKNKKRIADLIGSENLSKIDNSTILIFMKSEDEKKNFAEILLDKHKNLDDDVRKKLERTAAGEENVFK